MSSTSPTFAVVHAADRKDPGLEILLVCGVGTQSFSGTPTSGWHQCWTSVLPVNARVSVYDARIYSHRRSWSTFEQQTLSLSTELKRMYAVGKGSGKRPFVLIGYGLGGMLLKRALVMLNGDPSSERFTQDVQGIVFVATPHLEDSDKHSHRILNGVAQGRARINNDAISQEEVQKIATCSRQFRRLRWKCPILSCYEKTDTHWIGWFQRGVQVVDQKLATISAANERFEALDCKLSDVFSAPSTAIFTSIVDFLEMTSASLGISATLSSNGVVSDPADSFHPDRQGLSTPTPKTSPVSTDSEAEIIYKPTDIKVPTGVEYVQTQGQITGNPCFLGRDEILLEMDQVLLPSSDFHNDRKPRTYTISGAAGLGKTQIASHFFHSRKDNFDVALWLQAGSKLTLAAGFQGVAMKLGLKTNQAFTHQRVLEWLADPLQDSTKRQSNRMKWLVVFDSADQLDVLHGYWPKNSQGSVIITTRDAIGANVSDPNNDGTMLRPLDIPDAVALLQKKLPPTLLQLESPEDLQKLVRRLSCFPLAIVHTCRKMERFGQTPSDFLKSYESERIREKVFKQRGDYRDEYHASLIEIWSLDTYVPQTAELLATLSMFMPESIPEMILAHSGAAVLSSDFPQGLDYWEAMNDLLESSTVSRTKETDSNPAEILVHALVQEVVRAQLLKDQDGFVRSLKTATQLLLAVWPCETRPRLTFVEPNSFSTWNLRDNLVPHLSRIKEMFACLSVSSQRESIDEDYLTLLNEVAWYHFHRYSLNEASEYVDELLRLFKLSPWRYPRSVAAIYATASRVAICRNQPLIALDYSSRALEMENKLCEETGIMAGQQTAALATRALALIMNGDLEAAAVHLEESIRIRRKMPKFTKLVLYTPVLYLATIDFLRGDYKEALAKLKRLLGEREEQYGRNDIISRRCGGLHFCISIVLTRMGAFPGAREHLRQAHNNFADIVGDDDFGVAHCCYHMAADDLRDNALFDAEKAIDRAIHIFAHSKYHLAQLARSTFLKSQISLAMNQQVRAAEELAQSLHLRKSLVPAQDFQTVVTLKQEHFDQLVGPSLIYGGQL